MSDTAPPHEGPVREATQTTLEAAVAAIPIFGGPAAILLHTGLTYRLQQRRDEWLAGLYERVEVLSQRPDAPTLEEMLDDPRFVDAVVSGARTVEHTHQQEKLDALQNAVLNSVGPDALDADTQAIFLSLVDRYTPSHLRLLTMWDDPPSWFESHGYVPRTDVMSGPRGLTVEVGLPEMAGRSDFYLHLASEMFTDGLMIAHLEGGVSGTALMDRLTSDLGRQFVRSISAPRS